MHNRHTYYTRVGWWYWLLCFLTLGFCAKGSWPWEASFLQWVLTIYLFSLTRLTRYVVEGVNLTVFYGFFLKKTIPVSSITSIRPTHNVLSSPALSLRRLSIRYNKYDEILVSPEEPEAFVAALKAVNPKILTQKG